MVDAYFLDTSALVKKYMAERGSTWIETLTDAESDNTIILARVTWVETLSAFTRLNGRTKLTQVCWHKLSRSSRQIGKVNIKLSRSRSPIMKRQANCCKSIHYALTIVLNEHVR